MVYLELMRLQLFKNVMLRYWIQTTKRNNYYMYTLSEDGDDTWDLLVESLEDKQNVLDSLKKSGWDGKIRCFMFKDLTRKSVREYHKDGEVWFSLLFTLDSEPGPKFHQEMKKRGLTRAYTT